MELIIGAFEDNDDENDTATGNCDWVLSIRDKPKLNNLVFKPVHTTSQLRALRDRQKGELEKMLLMLMQQNFLHVVASIRGILLADKDSSALCGSCYCCCCCSQCAAHSCNNRIKPELNNFPTKEK